MPSLDPSFMSATLIEVCNEREAKERLAVLAAHESVVELALSRAAFELQAVKQVKQSKPHKARKAHICCECGGEIKPETYYTKVSIITGYGYSEGSHYTSLYKHHPNCPTQGV
jgi:hypothetical protein